MFETFLTKTLKKFSSVLNPRILLLNNNIFGIKAVYIGPIKVMQTSFLTHTISYVTYICYQVLSLNLYIYLTIL